MAIRKIKTTPKSAVAKPAPLKKNPWKITSVSLTAWIIFWALILCTMTIVVLNFNKAFAPVATETIDDQTTAEFQAIRTSLEKQAEELQVQAMQNTTPVQTATEACDTTNPGPADSHVMYVDPKTHISMSLPYSTSWGSDCVPVPLEVATDGISFGPSFSGVEGDGITRDAHLTIANATDASAAIKELNISGAVAPGTKIKTQTISGLTVASFTQDGLPGFKIWEAYGKSFHYTISSLNWLTDAEAVKIIQSFKVTK